MSSKSANIFFYNFNVRVLKILMVMIWKLYVLRSTTLLAGALLLVVSYDLILLNL